MLLSPGTSGLNIRTSDDSMSGSERVTAVLHPRFYVLPDDLDAMGYQRQGCRDQNECQDPSGYMLHFLAGSGIFSPLYTAFSRC